MRRLAAPAALVVVLASSTAQAAPPRVKADVTPEIVAPGVPFELQVEATSGEAGGVSELTVATPAGFKKLGERKTTTSSIVMSPQGTERRQGLNVVYTFSSEKVGTSKLGPISIRVGKERYTAEGPRVQIAKDAPPPRARDPFAGMFGGFPTLPGLDDDPFFSPPPARGTVDPSLALPAPRGDVLFFHARTDPSDLVIGQRLLFDVLEYVEEGVRPPDFADVREAKTNDFLSKAVEVKRDPRDLGFAEVAGKRYSVKLFRRYELSPLRAGKLEIGPLVGQVPTRSGKTTGRESETLTVTVREPPASGRPNGYQIGTVGPYDLKVEPVAATLHTGERSALVVHVTGAGTPPSKLQFRDFGNALRLGEPEIVDQENGAPQVSDPIPGLDDGDPRRATITRTFKYLLEAREPGRIELGAVTLPTYLVAEKRYDQLTSPLGTIEVSGVAQADDPDDGDPKRDRVALDLGAPLDALAGTAPARATTVPTWAYAIPLATPLLSWLVTLVRSLATRSSATRAKKAIKTPKQELDAALASGDIAGLQRFTKLLVAHVLGVESAPPREEWISALVASGKDHDDAMQLDALVTALDEARYAGQSEGRTERLTEDARSFRTRWVS